MSTFSRTFRRDFGTDKAAIQEDAAIGDARRGDFAIRKADGDSIGLATPVAARLLDATKPTSQGPFPLVIDLTTLTAAQGFIIQGDVAGDRAGRSVSNAGDVNGDGIDDVVVGAVYGDNSGEAYVIFGTRGGFGAGIDLTSLTAAQGFIIQGDAAGDRAGISVSNAGDVNGDGIDDLIIGAHFGDNGGYNAGEAYVIFGTRAGFGSGIDLASLSAAQGFIIQGDVAGDRAGFSVSNAGDVNGDGIDDLIVGAYRGDNGGDGAGEAYVIFGTRAGFGAGIDLTNLTAAQGFIIQGDTARDYAGFSVSNAGDVNGDGIDDLIVGADSGDNGGTDAGEAYVIFGTRAGFGAAIDLTSLTAVQGFIIQGAAANDLAGGSVSSAGDVNGDGIDDLIVGAEGGDNGSVFGGEAYVIFGSRAGFGAGINLQTITPAQGFLIKGDSSGDGAGYSVSAAGDVNGDGIDDLIVGARGGDHGGTSAGEAYVIFGTRAGFGTGIDLTNLTAAQGFIIQGDATDDRAGGSVSGAGDVNGDGIDDLIVGAPQGDNGGANAGEAYVIYGQALVTQAPFPLVVDLSNLTAADGFIIQGDAAGDQAGRSVSDAGDVNGDGIGDIVVGASRGDNGGADAGEAYVIFGSRAGFGTIDLTALTAAQGFIIQGDAAGDQAGRSVSAAGDVNGDGIGDLIVGAPYGADAGPVAGEAYVIFGTRAGFGATIDLTTLTAAQGFVIQGDEAVDLAGVSVSAAGDVNGDGIDDLIVGAYGGDSPGKANAAGEAVVIYGTRAGFGAPVVVAGNARQVIDITTLTAAQGFLIKGDLGGDNAGISVSAAGDVNGDGISDIVVGAYAGDNGGNNAGEAYVIFGSRAGFGTIDFTTFTEAQGFIIQGDEAGDQAGRSVSNAGDVNGDGIDDLIVGASYGDNGGGNAGEAYVIFGTRAGFGSVLDLTTLTAAQGFIIQGDAADDLAGRSVSAAGDVNGDGIGDILVGAIRNDDGGQDAGAAYVIYGSRAGFGTSVNIAGNSRQVIDLTTLTAEQGFTIQGDMTGDQAGWSVSAAGDVNGDGIDDLIVGAPFGDDGGDNAGEAYVIYGRRVAPPNEPPVANDDPALTATEDQDSQYSTELTGNDDDPDAGDTLTIVSAGNATNGSVSVTAGVVTFTPTANYNGIATFEYTIDDGNGNQDTAVATVTVSAVNDPVTIGAPATAALNEDAVDFAVTGVSIADIDSALAPAGVYEVVLQATQGTLKLTTTTGLTFTAGDGDGDSVMTFHATLADLNTALATLKYTPAPDYNGAAQINIDVIDEFGAIVATGSGAATADFKSIDLTVNSVNDEPAGTDEDADVTATVPYAFLVTDFSAGFSDAIDGDSFAGVRITTLPAVGTLALNGVAITAGDTITLAQLTAGDFTYEAPGSAADTQQTFTFQVQDNGGTANGGVDLDQSPNTFTLDVAQGNNAPVLDLNGPGSGTSNAITFSENDPPTAIAPVATAVDPDMPADFDGATLTVEFTSGGATDDLLRVSDGSSFQVDESGAYYVVSIPDPVTGDPVQTNIYFASISGGTDPSSPLVVTFNANATPALVQDLVRAVGFANFSNAPTAGDRIVSYDLMSGDGLSSSTVTATVTVVAVDDPPVAVDDQVFTPEDLVYDGNVFASNGGDEDGDPDGPPIQVIAVEGQGANVGQPITLPSGAIVILNADGTFSYDPNGRFNSLAVLESGAVNTQANDGFTYTITGGVAATVTVTVTGVAGPGDTLMGDGDGNMIVGSPQSDFFDLRQGGDDAVSGQGGNDGFYFGAAYTGADSVDGGAGIYDQIGLQGDYSGGVTLGSLLGTELVVLLPGDDARFGGQTGTDLTYSLVADANTIVSDNKLTIQANSLRAGETLVFDGSASSIDFLIYAGLGTDSLTGGSGNDGFFFGDGRFAATDVVHGGAGTMDQLGLQGNYSGANAVTFGAGQLSGLEFIVLLSASDNRFGASGGTVSYNLTMNNANVGVGQTLIVSANTLKAGESLVFDGSAETDGSFQIFSGAGSDSLVGGQRADDLRGGASLDYIRGLGGADILYGGAGNDNFEYVQASDSTAAARDRIMDFGGRDSIDLGVIAFLTGDSSAFTFIGNGPQTGARQLQVIQTGSQAIVNLFIDADATADLVIEVNIADGQTLTVEDFNGAIAPVPQAPLGKAAGAATPDKLGVDGFDGGYLRSDLSDFTSSLPDIVAIDMHGLGGSYDLVL